MDTIKQYTANLQKPRNRKGLKNSTKESLVGWSFILPMLIGFCIFCFIPIITSLGISFTDWNLLQAPKFVGLQNYTRLIKDSSFIKCVSNTLFFVLTMVPSILVISLILALILNKGLKGRGFFRAAFYIPCITSTVAISMVWLWIYGPQNGVLNSVLGTFGISSVDWLGNPLTAKPALVIMRIWQASGYYMLMFLAGLQTIPDSLYEVAEIDGATKWEKIRHITLPLLAPTMFLVIILLTIESFNIFEAVYVMTEGGPAGATDTLMYYIYHNGFRLYNMGYASSIAWFLFLVLIVLTLIQFKFKKEDIY
ncbi:sugar ABC transporter permease [Clostridium swellfunianum]|uniref:carbohydrate ABC transporter permease n=1 Tax=Clostridium swellfunianum TaxID=1367462 RepID=UPI00202ECEC1|nr:sugar ABC transporter permease [Clostridium swellfunianum]MCM0646911.1 sugar ABC transporter permease [Clostridium swellfunianum]